MASASGLSQSSHHVRPGGGSPSDCHRSRRTADRTLAIGLAPHRDTDRQSAIVAHQQKRRMYLVRWKLVHSEGLCRSNYQMWLRCVRGRIYRIGTPVGGTAESCTSRAAPNGRRSGSAPLLSLLASRRHYKPMHIEVGAPVLMDNHWHRQTTTDNLAVREI